MPLLEKMTKEERRRAIRAINAKISALSTARKKLRDRRDRGVNENELLLIALEMTRLKFKQNSLLDWKAAFKLNEKSLPAPSAEKIREMRAKVRAIRDLNAEDAKTRAIVRAAVEIAGSLPSASLS